MREWELRHYPTRKKAVYFSTLVVFILSAFSASPVLGQATLENPAPNSFQSGIGVISGWACEASRIEIAFDNGPTNRWRAGTGTQRTDTHGVCGDTDNGFGLLFNWNLLNDGTHTVRAFADGVEFANVTVTVTTLGEEFLRGARGLYDISEFHPTGRPLDLIWQEALQNFVLAHGSPPDDGGTSGSPPRILESPAPGSFQSGVGVISGWVCDAQTVEVSINGGPRLKAGIGTLREDTASVCGDTDNGFALLYNWNRLGDGSHTLSAYADGVEFASVSFQVTTLGEEFKRGVSQEYRLLDFPVEGTTVKVKWQEPNQNFVLTDRDMHGDTVETATELTLPDAGSVRVEGHIAVGDVDIFRARLPDYGYYRYALLDDEGQVQWDIQSQLRAYVLREGWDHWVEDTQAAGQHPPGTWVVAVLSCAENTCAGGYEYELEFLFSDARSHRFSAGDPTISHDSCTGEFHDVEDPPPCNPRWTGSCSTTSGDGRQGRTCGRGGDGGGATGGSGGGSGGGGGGGGGGGLDSCACYSVGTPGRVEEWYGLGTTFRKARENAVVLCRNRIRAPRCTEVWPNETIPDSYKARCGTNSSTIWVRPEDNPPWECVNPYYCEPGEYNCLK